MAANQIGEQDFQDLAEEALEALDTAFSRVGARLPVESDFDGGVLRLTFTEPDDAVFVISPNGPARQIWVSARLQSFKFDWDEEAERWQLHGTGEPIKDVLQRLAREQLGDESLTL
jgi:CyaY protein